MGRLKLHSPSQALRLHEGTPHKLWECAIAVNKINGGVPSFYSDKVVRKALEGRGIRKEDLWNYCLIGCVEPSIGGEEWPACGGIGISTYVNFVNMFTLAINDGKPYMFNSPVVDPACQAGPHTGYLYDMKSIDEVMAAYKTQMEYWTTWYATLVNIHEDVTRREIPQPVISASMTGCMESGRDVMDGGSKYNSTGMSGIGLGNVAESFNVINQLCFEQKKCTTRELYDALMANWEGYEELRQYIIGRVPHYGNGDAKIDRFAAFTADSFSEFVPTLTSHRGHFAAGMYPVTMNVVFGKFTPATPDSRKAGDSLSDGISAVQSFDTNGPTSELLSVTSFDHTKYSNGILLNMKFHPTALANDAGVEKLIDVMKTYFFELNGMEMQMNIVSTETLRDAQEHPENYKDLVVRIAGFSAYFVEVYKDAQNALIRRTELNL
jgi:formate C-acetyltransferase